MVARTLPLWFWSFVVDVGMDGWMDRQRRGVRIWNELGFLFRLPWLAELVILWGVGETRGLVSW